MTVFLPDPRLLASPRGRVWPRGTGSGQSPRVDPPPERADVVIVGAGLAGLALTSALWHLGVRDVVLLDRGDRPVGQFLDRVDQLDQRVLRSPYWHHPGVEGYRDCELLDFARLHWGLLTRTERREIRMAQAGHRSVVPVDVFEAYCRHVAATHGVDGRTWQATVRQVRPNDDGTVAVHSDRGTVTARGVALCLGEERRPAPPTWWIGEHRPPHISYWDEPAPEHADSVAVVGAGLTAAHLVANALRAGRQVRWVLREQRERYQCSDVNASFFRAEGRARFDGVPWEDRLALMARERRATVMFEFRPTLEQAEADGRLRVYRGRAVTGLDSAEGGPVTVWLSDGEQVMADHVMLALGTTVGTGTGLLPDDVVALRDGWPDLDERTLAYRRASNVFTVGAAACMVLGPAARNIDGHRVATARVATAIAARLAGVSAEALSGLRSKAEGLV